MPSQSDEGGLRRHRIEFVRENRTSEGEHVTPANPAWEPYSDNIRTFEWTPGPGNEEQRGIGDADPSNHHKGPEEHQLTVLYDLQRWFVTGAGAAQDAAYDGLARTVENKLPNTHTVADREDKTGVAATNLVDAAPAVNARDVRLFTIGLGGHIGTASVTGDPSDQQPVAVELEYEFEKVRTYQIDQPTAATTLAVAGLEAGTSITLEGEGGTPSVTLTADGTTVATFDNLDAAYLSTRQGGDVTVTATNDGDVLTVIEGANSYDGIEGDRGVPALGTGSHAAAVGTNYETILGDTITRGGTPLAYDVNSKAVEVDNNVDRTARSETMRQRIHVGDRDTSVTATVLGETESHAQILDALTTEESDIVWTLTGGTLTVPSAALTEPGNRTVEQGEAAMTLDNTFNGQGVVIA